MPFTIWSMHILFTESSPIADGPRDSMRQSKSCQLLHNSVRTTCTTDPEQIKVMESEGYSRPMCNDRTQLQDDAIGERDLLVSATTNAHTPLL